MRLTNKQIIKDDNPLLKQLSLDVELPLREEDETLLRSMYEYVVDSSDPQKAEQFDLSPASGLAAIQVGHKKKMLVVVVADSEEETGGRYALVNPKIISNSVQYAYLENGEGCLSVATFHEGHVYRAARITVEAYDLLSNQHIKIRARGYLAIVLQHEIDHLNGILYYDRINMPMNPEDIKNAKVIV
ncbi:MAG: peptide deformylase [Breznakia sp.]